MLYLSSSVRPTVSMLKAVTASSARNSSLFERPSQLEESKAEYTVKFDRNHLH
jgi:hypothetical protein